MRRVAFCLLAALLSSCGGGGGDGGSAPPIQVTPPAPEPPVTPPAPPPPATLASISYVHDVGAQTGGPVLAGDGNLYFPSNLSRNSCRTPYDMGCGSILRRTPAGDVSIVYDFGQNAGDGYLPFGLIIGHDGALYGMTQGGPFHGGTIFRLGLDGQYKVLHRFGETERGVYDPSALVAARDGNFYGVSYHGGTNDCPQIPRNAPSCGTAFRMTAQGEVTIISNFGAGVGDGITPNSLMQASDGNLYGTTGNGGSADNCGTLFRLSPAGTRTNLKIFCQSREDASAPQYAPIQASDGALYGVTASGGGGNCGWQYGCGTVYRMTLAGDFSVLYAFAPENRQDGDGPNGLIQGRDGLLYGTTTSGGAHGSSSAGTIYRMTLAGKKTILHSFGPIGNNNPSRPMGMIQLADGSFMGVNDWGRNGYGTIFSMTLK